jgi:chromosome segregation ATPase
VDKFDRGTSAGGAWQQEASSAQQQAHRITTQQQVLHAELAGSQVKVQELQQLLLERNLVIQQLSEELVQVSNEVQGFEATVLRCEATTAQLKSQLAIEGRSSPLP